MEVTSDTKSIQIPEQISPEFKRMSFDIVSSPDFTKEMFNIKVDTLAGSYTRGAKNLRYRNISLSSDAHSVRLANSLIRRFRFSSSKPKIDFLIDEKTIPFHRECRLFAPTSVAIPDEVIADPKIFIASWAVSQWKVDTEQWWSTTARKIILDWKERCEKFRAKEVAKAPEVLLNQVAGYVRRSFKLDMSFEQVKECLNMALIAGQKEEVQDADQDPEEE